MDVIILVVLLYSLFNGYYVCLPVMGLIQMTLGWEERLQPLERWKWKLSLIPKSVISMCQYYRNMTFVKYVNDNMKDTMDMLQEILMLKSTTCNKSMNHLMERLDKMPYDILKNVPPEQMQMVRENETIQKMVNQINETMEKNVKIREKIKAMNIDTRLKSLLNNLKQQ